MKRTALVALIFTGLLAGCRAYNSHNPYPSKTPAPNDFSFTKDAINRSVEPGSPNL
jgi:hypothetical protein